MRSRSSARACPNLSVPPKGCTSFSSRLEEHCSGTCKTKKFFSEARRIGCEPAVHWQAPSNAPNGGVGTPDVAETGSSSITKAQSRLLPSKRGSLWGARVRPGVYLGEAETCALTTTSCVGDIFRPIPRIVPVDFSATSRRKWAA